MSEQPPLRIVRGEPTPEELAALAALVTAAGSGEVPEPAAQPRGRWNDPALAHRKSWRAGPGGWRAAQR